MLSQLHFQHPLWFLALLPLALLLWQVKSRSDGAKSWTNVIDKNLLPLLMQGEDRQAGKMIKWLLGLGWLLTILALADPVWEKIPRPVFQTNSARVIVLDLSNSMLINDLKPSRMARARFKVEDILSRQEEGQVGLVVFAGDGFTASPLTRDADTIRSLLKVLNPNLMPTQGSRADLGIAKAHELLTQANINNGQVLLITDGASDLKKAEQAAKALKKDGHTLSILAVGTETGGQLQLRGNQIVTVPLDINSLEKIAKKGGGVLHTITNNDNDLKAVLKTTINGKKVKQQQANDLKSSNWKSTGPYLILLLLPFAALAFRKGWLLSVLLSATLVVSLSPDEPLMAAENEAQTSTNNKQTSISESKWESLFENSEQRAAKALLQKQYDKASTLSKEPLRKGSAEYKKGNFKQALESFKSARGADARYNEGNALAKLKKYKEAIKAYEEALKEKPNMADALANKKALEDFLKKQKEQQKKNKQKKDSQKNKDNKKEQNQKNKDQKQSGKQDEKNKQNKNQKNQQKKGDKQQQDKNNKSGKDSKKSQQGKENKKDQQDKNKKNQFSEANKELDKKKKETGNKKNQPSQEKGQKPKGEQGKKKQDTNKDKQSADSKGKEKSKSKDKKGDDKKSKQQKSADKKQKDQAKKAQKNAENAKARAKAEELSKEEKMAAEQWLRRIPDDPGGLLRRKFRSQYQRRNRTLTNEKPW